MLQFSKDKGGDKARGTNFSTVWSVAHSIYFCRQNKRLFGSATYVACTSWAALHSTVRCCLPASLEVSLSGIQSRKLHPGRGNLGTFQDLAVGVLSSTDNSVLNIKDLYPDCKQDGEGLEEEVESAIRPSGPAAEVSTQ